MPSITYQVIRDDGFVESGNLTIEQVVALADDLGFDPERFRRSLLKTGRVVIDDYNGEMVIKEVLP